MTKNKITVLYALVSEENVILQYFKNLEDLEIFFDTNGLEEAVILTVAKAESVVIPPEPTLEITEIEFSTLLEGECK